MAAATQEALKAATSAGRPPLLYVYTLDKDPAAYSFSPFAIKLRLRLRHGGVPYEDRKGSLGESPKKKMPYVRFLLPEQAPEGEAGAEGGRKDGGELMGDSGLITERLVMEGKLPDCNGALSREDQVRDLALRALLEDKLYFLLLYERFKMCYTTFRDHGVIAHLPWGVRHVAFYLMSCFAALILYFQGTGRHKPGEVTAMIEKVIDGLAVLATSSRDKAAARRDSGGGTRGTRGPGGTGEDEPFWILGNEGPSEADFSLFGDMASLVATDVNPLFRDGIKKHAALADYFRKIHNKYFAEVPCPL